jgi:hypothetical protein
MTHKLKISLFALIIVLGSTLFGIPGFAQQNITFSSLQIDLWPEYDRSEMLVVYRFELAASVQLPVDLSIRIPTAAGMPNAVAESAIGGALLNLQYSSVVQGEWTALELTATQREIQIEYYDPSLIKEGTDRTFVYTWPGDYDVNRVLVIIQQPIGAENMNIFPRLNEQNPDPDDGILYYSGEIGSFKAGETFERSIAYEKESDTLTVEFLKIESLPITENTPGRVSLVSILPWGIGLLGIIIILAGVYWYWATEKKPLIPRRGKRTDATKEQSEHPRDIYCHQCGKRAEGGDKFCRTCGTKLRV